MKSNTNEKRHACTFEGCKASFPRPSKLAIHMQIHEGGKPFQCDIDDCDKAYTTKAHLKRHQSIQHEQITNRVACSEPDCNKDFSNLSNMKKHLKRAHNPNREYNYVCTECNQSFPKKKLLHQHSYLHTGEFYYKCNECNKGFHLLSDLNRHKSSHTLYPCDKCKMVFQRWSDLRKHKITHRILFKCRTCNFKSYRRVVLSQHETIHSTTQTNIKKFKCVMKDCNRSYLYKRNLTYHIKVYHEGWKAGVVCTVDGCGRILSKMNALKDHIRLVHNSPPRAKRPRRIRKDAGKPRIKEIERIVLSASIQETHETQKLVPIDLIKV